MTRSGLPTRSHPRAVPSWSGRVGRDSGAGRRCARPFHGSWAPVQSWRRRGRDIQHPAFPLAESTGLTARPRRQRGARSGAARVGHRRGVDPARGAGFATPTRRGQAVPATIRDGWRGQRYWPSCLPWWSRAWTARCMPTRGVTGWMWRGGNPGHAAARRPHRCPMARWPRPAAKPRWIRRSPSSRCYVSWNSSPNRTPGCGWKSRWRDMG